MSRMRPIPRTARVLIPVLLTLLAGPAVAGRADGAPDARGTGSPPVAEPPAPPPPGSLDTRANLDAVFTNELNMRERYLACARQADAEGFAAVARLFRACARSEQIHADRHVQAIAWMGGEAKAMLGQLGIAGTADNLRTAIELERYESTELYPALIARARTDRQAMAVRSMTFALAAEREHLALLTEALTRLEQRPAAPAFHVCSYCGKTVTVLDSRKCPHCFTPASRFAVVE